MEFLFQCALIKKVLWPYATFCIFTFLPSVLHLHSYNHSFLKQASHTSILNLSYAAPCEFIKGILRHDYWNWFTQALWIRTEKYVIKVIIFGRVLEFAIQNIWEKHQLLGESLCQWQGFKYLPPPQPPLPTPPFWWVPFCVCQVFELRPCTVAHTVMILNPYGMRRSILSSPYFSTWIFINFLPDLHSSFLSGSIGLFSIW